MTRKCKSNFLRLLHNDLKYGTKSNWIKFAIAFLFTVTCCMFLYKSVAIKIVSQKVKELPGLFDYIVYVLGGMKEYIQAKDKTFDVPFIWATFQLLVGFAVLTYPIRDLEGRGMAILVNSENRRNWWISKCIWTVIQVLCIYAIIWAGIIVSFIVIGNYSFTLNQDICAEMIGISLKSTSGLILFAIVLPVISSIMFALAQMSLSLIIGPMFSLTLVFAYQVISSYVMSAFLLGNYSMILRCDRFVKSGVNANIGIIAELCISAIFVIVGSIYFQKYDVLEKE